jgi:hypothetical protein
MLGTSTTLLPPVALGSVAGLGVLALIAGLTGRRVLIPLAGMRTVVRRVDHLLIRVSLASVVGASVLLLTHWPVAGVVGAAVGAWLPTGRELRRQSTDEISKVEAIATWTEQLRDTLGAASGLQSALVATAALAPRPIAPAVERLAARLEYERAPDALRRLSAEVAHPVADFVVAALLVAAEHEARDLGGLLGQLAATAREEARMRTRVWVGRSRMRTSVRIIAGIIPAMIGAVLVLDRQYLDPYDTAGGQLVLLAVLLVFLGAFAGMQHLGRIRLPQRFLARRPSAGLAT